MPPSGSIFQAVMKVLKTFERQQKITLFRLSKFEKSLDDMEGGHE